MPSVTPNKNAFELIEDAIIRKVRSANTLPEGYWEYCYDIEYDSYGEPNANYIEDSVEIEKLKNEYKNKLIDIYQDIKNCFSIKTIRYFKGHILEDLHSLSPEDKLIKILSYQELCENFEPERFKEILLAKIFGNKSVQPLNYKGRQRIFFNILFRGYKDQYNSYKQHIDELFELFTQGKLSDISDVEAQKIILSKNPIFTISNKPLHKLQQLKGNKSLIELDKFQTALLFHYLMKYNAILNFDNKSLADVIEILTAHSAQIIRTECLGFISQIKCDKEKDRNHPESNYNLITLKNLLEKILSDIDQEIVKNGNKLDQVTPT